MKRNILLCVLVIIVGVVGIFVFSCNKSTGEAVCGSCKAADPLTKQFSIKVNGNKEEELLLRYYKSSYKTGDTFEMGNISVNDTLYTDLIQYFKQISNIDSDPYAIVVYFNRYISNTNAVTIEEMSGFSWYYLIKEGKQLHHRLFISKNGSFIENKEFNIDVPYLTVNQSSFLVNVIIPQFQNNSMLEKSYLTIFKKSQSFKKYKFGRNEFIHIYNKYKASSSLFKDSNPGEDDCPYPCPGQGNMCIETTQNICDPNYSWDPCASTDQEQILLTYSGMDEDSVHLAYDSATLYEFKDSVLSPRTFGQKYIDYYYDLSTKLRGKGLPIALILSTAKTSIHCRHMLQLLQDPTANADSIFLSRTQRDELLQLVDGYKSLFTDAVTIGILNDIKSDISYYTGYRVQDFFNDIE
jgi:hypothetical protein